MSNNNEKFLSNLKAARNHFEGKAYKNARLMYFQALNHAQDHESKAIIWAEVSWVYYYEKDYQKAIESAENVLLHDKDYKAPEDLYRVQGYAYLGLGNFPLAEKSLLDSLDKNSSDEKQNYVKYELGKLYFGQGSYDLAYPYFNKIIDYFRMTKHEYGWSVLFYLGFITYYLQNFTKSREYFELILTDDAPRTRIASANFGLAFLEFQAKNYLNVISLCEGILDHDKKFFDKESVGFLTAASYYHLGRKDIFLAYFDQMKESYPNGRYNTDLDKLKNMID